MVATASMVHALAMVYETGNTMHKKVSVVANKKQAQLVTLYNSLFAKGLLQLSQAGMRVVCNYNC
jgi:hypothetical protein